MNDLEYIELLHQQALKQIPQVNKYLHNIHKEKLITHNDNPLIDSSLPGIYLLAIHLGLWGWPDSKEELDDLLDYCLHDWDISFGSIVEKWGIEPTCVIGGYETRDSYTSIDVSNIGKLELPLGTSEKLLNVVHDIVNLVK